MGEAQVHSRVPGSLELNPLLLYMLRLAHATVPSAHSGCAKQKVCCLLNDHVLGSSCKMLRSSFSSIFTSVFSDILTCGGLKAALSQGREPP